MTKSTQEPEHPFALNVLPAQSPQSAMFMMMPLSEKSLSMSHCELTKDAVGTPCKGGRVNIRRRTRPSLCNQLTQLSVLTWSPPFRTSWGGDWSLVQDHILMLVAVRSIASQPPPFSLKAGPYDFALGSATPHPELPFARALQSVDNVLPVWFRLVGMVHPGAVWRVIVFGPTSFTPSRMSTSPP